MTDCTAVMLAPASTSSTGLGWINTPGLNEGVGEGILPSSWLFGVKTDLAMFRVRGRWTGLGGRAVGPLMLAGRTKAGGG